MGPQPTGLQPSNSLLMTLYHNADVVNWNAIYRENPKEVKLSMKNDERSYTEALVQAAEDAAVKEGICTRLPRSSLIKP